MIELPSLLHVGDHKIYLWSLATLPPLMGIWTTAFFGLNDVHPPHVRQTFTRSGVIALLLGLSYLMATFLSFMMIVGVVGGVNVYTWRGSMLMWSIFGIFCFAGRFAPWRRFIRRLADFERMERKWRGTPGPTLNDLGALIAEGRQAIRSPIRDRGDALANVVPRLVIGLERIAARQIEVAALRTELKEELGALRGALKRGQSTANHVARINCLLDRLEGTLRYG